MNPNTPKNTKALRSSNKTNIAYLLYSRGDTSRLQLSKITGLTNASITQIVQELQADGMVEEVGEIKTEKKGRREILLHFAGDKYAAVGVNIESDNTHVSICTLDEVLYEEIYPTAELLKDGNVDRLIILIKKAIDQKPVGLNLLGIGVGITGIVDEVSGTAVNSYGLLPKDYPLKDILIKSLSCDVEVINNIRAQARALVKERNRDFMLFKHEPGVGCAIVVGGQIVKGVAGRSGEVGHTIVKIGGEKCRCGKCGCLEAYTSKSRIEYLYYQKTGNKLSSLQIYDLYDADKAAAEILDEVMDYLAVAIGNAATLTDPKRVLVTGGIFLNDNLLLQIFSRLNKFGYGIYKFPRRSNVNG